MTVMQMYDEFLLSKRLAGLSKETVRDYAQLLRPFVIYLGINEDFCAVATRDAIKCYIGSLIDKDISKATLATYIRNIKIFLKWAAECQAVQYDYQLIKVPKNPKRRVKIYSDSEVMQIFSAIDAESEWLVSRNKAIIALMYDSGLRQAEVCSLKWSTVSFSENRMTVRGKGDKERIVPLGKLTAYYLQEYQELCPHTSKSVFVGRRGQKLTCNSVKLLVSRLAARLPFELSSHKLRHNFATNYCLDQYDKTGQVDLFRLMILMGHEDIETTKLYLHLAYEIIGARDSVSHLDKIIGGV